MDTAGQSRLLARSVGGRSRDHVSAPPHSPLPGYNVVRTDHGRGSDLVFLRTSLYQVYNCTPDRQEDECVDFNLSEDLNIASEELTLNPSKIWVSTAGPWSHSHHFFGCCGFGHCWGGFCLFVWLVGFLTSSSTTRLYRGRAPRQSVWQFYVLPHTRQSGGDHDFCLSRSHYTDTDPTSREWAATAETEPGTSSPGVKRYTDWATPPPPPPPPCWGGAKENFIKFNPCVQSEGKKKEHNNMNYALGKFVLVIISFHKLLKCWSLLYTLKSLM